MALTIRRATPDDADMLIRIVDMSSEGLVPALWADMSPGETDGAAVGHALVTSADGEFSYRNAYIIEQDRMKLGGLIGYPLPTTPEPADPEVPDVFAAISELANLVLGYWYINFMAVEPEGRRRGLALALLNKAEEQASSRGCAGVALIVVASNSPAMSVYLRAGYQERARRPFDLSDFGTEPTEAVLMVKDLV